MSKYKSKLVQFLVYQEGQDVVLYDDYEARIHPPALALLTPFYRYANKHLEYPSEIILEFDILYYIDRDPLPNLPTDIPNPRFPQIEIVDQNVNVVTSASHVRQLPTGTEEISNQISEYSKRLYLQALGANIFLNSVKFDLPEELRSFIELAHNIIPGLMIANQAKFTIESVKRILSRNQIINYSTLQSYQFGDGNYIGKHNRFKLLSDYGSLGLYLFDSLKELIINTVYNELSYDGELDTEEEWDPD